MGYFMKEHDIYVGSMLDELNLRFAPPQGKEAHFGGIQEMVALQKEFKIFKKGRSFRTSISALSLGTWNHDAKNRWLTYLATLNKYESNIPKQNGDSAIVSAIIKNLAAKDPLPVFFTSHDMRGPKENNRVILTAKNRPIFYLDVDYLTISLPMQPLTAKNAARPGK